MPLIKIGGDDGCCICCCKRAYPGCCPCVPAGDMCFEIIATNEPCATGMSFTMNKATDSCKTHRDTFSDYLCLQCHSDLGTGVYPEMWGFTGTVCGGMCVSASLCCCVTGAMAEPSEQTCCGDAQCSGYVPTGTMNKCVEDGKCPCRVGCFNFAISPFYCHDWDGDGFKDSVCDKPLDPNTGQHIGQWTANSPATVISGQCASPKEGVKLMMLVEGDFTSACDCCTGIWQETPPAGGMFIQQNVHYSGLLYECS